MTAATTKKKPIVEKKSGLIVRARFVRMAPDKIRFAGKQIVGKELSQAINILEFSRILARKPLLLVLKNASSQIKDRNIDKQMYVKSVAVDEGPRLKRRRIISRGRATNILKRLSHITVVLTNDGKSKSQILISKQKLNNKIPNLK